MSDRLASLLQWFELRAQVFQAGPLCGAAPFDADGLGYVHLLRRGRLRVEVPGQRPLLLEQPSLLLLLAPSPHRLVAESDDVDTVCASIEFGVGLHNPLVVALPGPVLLELEQLPLLRATLDLLFGEAFDNHCGRQAILDRLMEVLLIQFLRELMDQRRLEVGLLAGLADPRLAGAINAMHAEPGRAWTLAELASTANLSRARFATQFRDTVGITPMAYLADWRLSLARSLLRRGKTVQLAADEVGYSSASALSRAFAAQTGLSPREWLRQQAAGAGVPARASAG